ncbi:hypothetical protein BaRGS_00019551, partial [Batillaria attramentaria]
LHTYLSDHRRGYVSRVLIGRSRQITHRLTVCGAKLDAVADDICSSDMAATRFHEMVGHLRGMELDEHDNDLEVSFVQQFQSMRQHGGVQKEVSGKRPEGTYALHIRLLRTFRQVVKPGELKGNKLICARRTIKVKRKASSDGLRRALLQAFPHLTGSFFEICFLQNGALCAVNMAHDMRTLKAILGPRAKIFVRPQMAETSCQQYVPVPLPGTSHFGDGRLAASTSDPEGNAEEDIRDFEPARINFRVQRRAQQNLTSRPPRRQAAVAGRLQVREWAGRVTPLNSPSIDLMTGTQDDSAEE